MLQTGLDVCFDGRFLRCWQHLNFRQDVTDAVIWIHAYLVEHLAIFFKQVGKIDRHGMANNNGI
jgi:hypothetical protein